MITYVTLGSNHIGCLRFGIRLDVTGSWGVINFSKLRSKKTTGETSMEPGNSGMVTLFWDGDLDA